MAQRRVGVMVAAMSLSSKTRWDPGCGLRQDWDRKSLQADPGRLQTCGGGSESVPGAGASLPGTLVSQCRREQVTAKVGGGGGNEEGGEGKTRLPDTGELEGHAVGVTAGLSPGRP